MTAVVQQKVHAGWHILDIGADIGYYTLLFGKQAGPQGAVVAFEPDPEPWPILNENIARHGVPNIRAFTFALSDHRGTGMMKHAGHGQLFPDTIAQGGGEVVVNMVTLNELWETVGWDCLDLVKIDVEGAELSVLSGMEKILADYHPHNLVEIHPRQLKEVFHASAEDVLHFLTVKYPYRLLPVGTDSLIVRDKNFTVWGDWKNDLTE